jgi:hypothetical protein
MHACEKFIMVIIFGIDYFFCGFFKKSYKENRKLMLHIKKDPVLANSRFLHKKSILGGLKIISTGIFNSNILSCTYDIALDHWT